MYSTVGLLKHSKHSGKLMGTHQKIDRAARNYLLHLTKGYRTTRTRKIVKEFGDMNFPTYKEIVHFEGMRGPDGLKRKSPGTDEPLHFIIPDQDDGKLIKMIMNHHHNLHAALTNEQDKDARARAAFEAAWLAHAITDGLTPAHHFPYQEALEELMTEKEYFTIFGQPVKGIMRGENLRESVKNNWKYWGVEGLMTKHIAFEYHVARIATRTSLKKMMPRLSRAELKRLKEWQDLDLKAEFYKSLDRVASLKMYDRFREDGWSKALTKETTSILLPEIVKMVTIGWLSALPIKDDTKKVKAKTKAVKNG